MDDLHVMCLHSGALSSPVVCFSPLFSFFFADDHSRVRLQTIEGDTNSDYINGNYIDVCILKLSVSPTVLIHSPSCIRYGIGGHSLLQLQSKHWTVAPHPTELYGKHMATPCLKWAYWLVTSSLSFGSPLLSCALVDQENVISIFFFVNNLDDLTLKKKSVYLLIG